MNHLTQSGLFELIQELLKFSTLTTAILRNIFHVLTASVASFLFIFFKLPCLVGGVCSTAFDWKGLAFIGGTIYFLFDITSLPQDIYYIWATTSPDINFGDSAT